MKVTILYRVRGYHIELSIYSIKFRGDYRSKMKNTQWGYWWSYSRMVRGWCILLLKIGIAFSFCTSGSGFICILDQAYGSLLYQDQPTWYFCLSRWSLCQHLVAHLIEHISHVQWESPYCSSPGSISVMVLCFLFCAPCIMCYSTLSFSPLLIICSSLISFTCHSLV